MMTRFFLLTSLILLISCGGNHVKNINFQELETIELKEFKKKNVRLLSSLRFLNENENAVFFKKVEFDVFVDGKDAGTYIKKDTYKVPKNGVYTINLEADFEPEKVFENLDYGIVKVKSDLVAEVQFKGFFVVSNSENEDEEITFSKTQKVLFSNNKKLRLDEDGKLIEKP